MVGPGETRKSRIGGPGEPRDFGDEQNPDYEASKNSDPSIMVQDGPARTAVKLQKSHSINSQTQMNKLDQKKGKNNVSLDEENVRLEQEATKLKDIRVKEQVERIEYNKFPSILGWYFDGTFNTPFKLNDLYAEYFSEVEEEMELKRDIQIRETFEEKASRNFWPPKWIGQFFRTRGVYLDVNECREDPPKTPPDVSAPGDDARARFGMDYGTASGRRIGDPRDKWYWTDVTRDFRQKNEEEQYAWWEGDGVWRIKESEERSPYAWYWHPKEGKFFVREKLRPDIYRFDQHDYIYIAKHVLGPSDNGLSPSDYYYCEIKHKWIPLNKVEKGETEFYMNGRRNIKKGPRPKNGFGPDDFYYSVDSGLMELKEANVDYYYDTHDEVFRKHGNSYGPGKSGLYPVDYVYAERNGMYLPKNPRELRKPSPYDWYFDDSIGRFYVKDNTEPDDYDFDQVNLVWRLKNAKGPSANGLGPEDYAYDETAHEWRLLNAIPPADLSKQVATKRDIVLGFRGTSDHKDDDYYYDAVEGVFILKDLKDLNSYYYHTGEGVFRRKGQSYGPGLSQHVAKDYYFDEVEGLWLLTQAAKHKVSTAKSGPQLLRTLYKTPYDYAFDCKEGMFVRRDEKAPSNYEFNQDFAVYVRKGGRYQGPSSNGRTPEDYYYDENEFKWLPLDEVVPEDQAQVVFYPNAKRNLRLGIRGTSRKIPDDFYFHKGVYLDKDPETPDNYKYDSAEGVWRRTDAEVKEVVGNKKPSDYFFSDEDGVFYLKRDLKYHQYIYDGNAPLYVQSFRAPDDYYWDGTCYLLKPPTVYSEARKNLPAMRLGKKGRKKGKKGKGVSNEDGDGGGGKGGNRLPDDPLTDYERPWLHNYVYQAADRIRFVQEVEKIKGREKIETDKAKKGSKEEASAVSSISTVKSQKGVKPEAAKPTNAKEATPKKK